MAPYLKYGNYQHDQAEVALVISKDAIYSQSGVRSGWIERWDINGRLQPADESQTGVIAALAVLENAYSTDGFDLGLYLDTGELTQHFIDSSATVGGTRVTRLPSYPTGEGAEGAVYRTYAITVEAEIPDLVSDPLLHSQESISWQGTGGPDWGLLQTLTGPPQPQTFAQFTPVRMFQRGTAVGNLAYPLAADPIWPLNELQPARRIDRAVPRRNSNERIVSWAYTYLATEQLAGLPTER